MKILTKLTRISWRLLAQIRFNLLAYLISLFIIHHMGLYNDSDSSNDGNYVENDLSASKFTF